MLEAFTVETFARHLGGTFRVQSGQPEPLEMELIDASYLGSKSTASRTGREHRTPFSILFRGPRNIVLPQRIYRIEHDEIGTFDLFLVPISPDEAGQRYEAVFS